MRALFGLLLAIGVTTLTLGCGQSSKSGAAGGGTDSLDGTYTIVATETNGQQFPAGKGETEEDRTVRIEGNKLIARKEGKDDPVNFKTDASKDPKEIDIIAAGGGGKGDTVYGIYKLEGDILTICMSDKAETRPKEFKTAEGSVTMMMTLKKKK